VEILELLAAARQPLAAVQIATALGLPRSSCAAMLQGLVGMGFLGFEPQTKAYVPTVRASLLGAEIDRIQPGQVVREALAGLAAATGGSAVAFMLCEGTAKLVAAAPGDAFSTRRDLGSRGEGALSAFFLAILSRLPDAEIRRLLRRAQAGGGAAVPPVDLPAAMELVAAAQVDGVVACDSLLGGQRTDLAAPVGLGPRHPPLAIGVLGHPGGDARGLAAAAEALRGIARRLSSGPVPAAADPPGPRTARRPSREPARLVVPFLPGGPTDVVARLYASQLSRRLGRAIEVVNLAGESGSIAASEVANAPADGCTLFLGTAGTQVANRLLSGGYSYDPIRDFRPIARLSLLYSAVSVHGRIAAGSLADLIAYSQHAPQALRYCTEGTRSLNHFGGEVLKAICGLDMRHVTRAGSASAASALTAGEVDVALFSVYNSVAVALSGRSRIVAVTAPHRLALLPAVPTLAELGFPEYRVTSWTGLFAPRGESPDFIEEVNAQLRAIAARASVRSRLNRIGHAGVPSSPDELAELVSLEEPRWRSEIARGPLATRRGQASLFA